MTDGLFNYVNSSYRLFLAMPFINDDRCASTSAFLLPIDEAARGGASASSTPAEPATK